MVIVVTNTMIDIRLL